MDSPTFLRRLLVLAVSCNRRAESKAPLLHFIAETRDWLCPEQAEFRANRSYEAPFLRVMIIMLQNKTVLALLDSFKALGRTWESICCLIQSKMPPPRTENQGPNQLRTRPGVIAKINTVTAAIPSLYN